MKSIYKFTTIMFFFFTCVILQVKGQSDIAGVGTGHGGASNTSYYVGWDVNTTFDLDVKHMATGANAKNINFYTNAAQKMTILGNNTSTDGYVGIGISAPVSLLHQHIAGNNDTWHQFTNGNTGTTTTDGLKIGLTYNSSRSLGEIRHQEDTSLIISTGAGSNYNERMRIDYGLGGNGTGGFKNVICTKVSLNHRGTPYPPRMAYALLNLGTPTATQTGARNWMDVGTFYSFGTDMLYTGMKDENNTTNGSDRKDPNWRKSL